jgi:uncharacterized membrane protein YoaK (UPF0700 family)
VRDSAVATDQDTASDPVSILAALLALTVVSGLVDAVSYLGLGHVFTANMTGNVVVLGFAAAGTPGFSVSATLTSPGVFLVGAAALIAFLAGPAPGWRRLTVIAVLALAMGMRNAAVRLLGIRDLTTTVLTQTLTGLAADSRFAGGSDPRAGRRIGAVACMLAGALAGALLLRQVDAALPLLIAAVATTGTAVAFGAGPAARGPVRGSLS